MKRDAPEANDVPHGASAIMYALCAQNMCNVPGMCHPSIQYIV